MIFLAQKITFKLVFVLHLTFQMLTLIIIKQR